MKKLLVLLCLILPLIIHAQDYRILKRQGDSLRFKKNFAEAVIAYNKCIDLVLSGRQTVYDDEWNGLLSAAMDVNKSNPRQYSELRYGTRAEKMSDKITTLKDMGVKYIFSFYIRVGMSTFSYSNWPYECHIGNGATYVLVWAINKNVFMQAFNVCNTYKSVKLDDSKLYELLKAYMDDLVKEKVKRMFTSEDGIEIYHFQFYTENHTIQKEPVDMRDFRTPEQNLPNEYKLLRKQMIDKWTEIYKYNIKTHFADFFTLVSNDVAKYYNIINSGAERARVGKFE